MLKKSLCLLLAFAVLLSLMGVSANETDENGVKTIFVASEDFSSVQGENNWYYKCRLGTTIKELPQYYSDTSVWKNTNNSYHWGQIGPDIIAPGVHSTSVYNAIRVFKAPYNGKIIIGAKGRIGAKTVESEALFGVNIRIMKNNSITIYPSSGGWENIATRSAVSNFSPFNVDVTKGDEIYFEVARNMTGDDTEQSRLQNILAWDPTITYTEYHLPITVYNDTFDNAEISKFFKDSTQNWSIVDQKLVADGTTAAQTMRYYMPYAKDYTVSFDLEFTSAAADNSYFAFNLRRPNGTGNFYQIKFDHNKTQDGNIVFGINENDIFSGGNGTGTARTRMEKSWALNTPYTIVVDISSDNTYDYITVKVNDETDYTYKFTAGTCPMGGGGFTLSKGCSVKIDNFKIEGMEQDFVPPTPADVKFSTSKAELNGEVGVTVTARNPFTSYSNKKYVCLVLAVYNSEGNLIAVDASDNVIDITSTGEITLSITDDVIDSTCKVKAFVWDRLNSMKPYFEAVELN